MITIPPSVLKRVNKRGGGRGIINRKKLYFALFKRLKAFRLTLFLSTFFFRFSETKR